MDILWRIYYEVVASWRSFVLGSRRSANRSMGRRRTGGLNGLGQFCLGESVTEVRVWRSHGILGEEMVVSKGIFEPLAVGQAKTCAICSDLNGMHDRFRDMSPPLGHVTRMDLIFTQSKNW